MQGHFCLSKDILGSIKWKIKRQMLVERAKYYAPGEDGKDGVWMECSMVVQPGGGGGDRN